jgi:hypothetical protein
LPADQGRIDRTRTDHVLSGYHGPSDL